MSLLLDPSLTAKATKELIELWLAAYNRNRTLTLLASAIFSLALVVLVSFLIIKEKEHEVNKATIITYEDQIRLLNDTQINLRNLTEFVEAEKKKLQESEKTLNNLKEEEKLLKPIIESDRQTIESIFQLQNQRNQANLSTERWIGFGLGIMASIVASIIWAAIAYFVNRRRSKTQNEEIVND